MCYPYRQNKDTGRRRSVVDVAVTNQIQGLLCDGSRGWAQTDTRRGRVRLMGVDARIIHTLHHRQWGNFTEMHPWEWHVKPPCICVWGKTECSNPRKQNTFLLDVLCCNIVGFQDCWSKTAFFLLSMLLQFYLHLWNCQDSKEGKVFFFLIVFFLHIFFFFKKFTLYCIFSITI